MGWATGVTNLAREWTAALCRHAQGLDESEVLALVWRMFGVEDLDLAGDCGRGGGRAFADRRPIRARSGSLKSADQWSGADLSASFSGSGSRTGAGLGAVVAGHGCDGCLFTVNAEDEGQVRVLGEALAGVG